MSITDWVKLQYVPGSISGAGHVLPRLGFNLQASPVRDQSEVHLVSLDADLLLDYEVLGRGQIVSWLGRLTKEGTLTVEVPLSRDGLAYIADKRPTGDLDLTLRLRGLLHVRHQLDDLQRNTGWEKGERRDVPFGMGPIDNLLVQIPRSDWVTKVLEPIGTTHYIMSVIEVPKECSRRPGWEAAVARLDDAERQYGLGDDPGVFLQCRGMLDALPGAKQDIFAKVPEAQKRTDLDKLVQVAGNYFHRGRHVANDGDQQGDFPVDHRDAGFALGLAKLILAYASAVVPPT